MKRLHSLDPAEVSLVPRGANKRKFLVLKSKKDAVMTKDELLKMISTEPDTMKKVDKILKDYTASCTKSDPTAPATPAPKVDEGGQAEEAPLDEKAQSAVKAMVRILTPFKGTLSPALVHEVLDAAGFSMAAEGEGMDKKEGSSRQSPEPIKEEHKVQAMKVAKAAFDAELKKLGYQKYPEGDGVVKDLDGDEDDVEKAKKDKEEDDMEDKGVEKSAVMKSLLSKVPEDMKGVVETIYKGQLEAIAKAEKLEQELDAVKKVARRKEMVAKAESFKSLGVPTQELADLFMALGEKAPAEFEKVEKMLSAADKQVEQGGLFEELGSSLPKGGSTTWEEIEQAAMGLVQKSGEKLTKEAAVNKFLETSDGQKMYSKYMSSHASRRD